MRAKISCWRLRKMIVKLSRLNILSQQFGPCHCCPGSDGWAAGSCHHPLAAATGLYDRAILNHLQIWAGNHVQPVADILTTTAQIAATVSAALCPGFKFHGRSRGVDPRDHVGPSTAGGRRGFIRCRLVLTFVDGASSPSATASSKSQGPVPAARISRSILFDDFAKASFCNFAIAGGGPEPGCVVDPQCPPKSWHFPLQSRNHRLSILAGSFGEGFWLQFDMHMATTCT